MSQVKSPVGLKFGRLEVIEYAGRNRNKKNTWRCRCDCGEIRVVLYENLCSGKSKSCGCLKKDLLSQRVRLDLTGQRFGRLVAIKIVGKKRHGIIWLCQCDCGGTNEVLTDTLRSGAIRSCGCLRLERISEKCRLDLTGQRFGRLVAIKIVGKKEYGTAWLCQCDCGKTKEVTTSNLRSGNSKSCGCLQAERASEVKRIDIIGQRFSKLVVLYPSKYRTGGQTDRVLWVCQCDCGNYCFVHTTSLTSGNTRSCGCLKIKFAEEVLGRLGNESKKIIKELMEQPVTQEQLRELIPLIREKGD
jgi:hypothetical protein